MVQEMSRRCPELFRGTDRGDQGTVLKDIDVNGTVGLDMDDRNSSGGCLHSHGGFRVKEEARRVEEFIHRLF
jgi:hypothetical protein